MELPPWVERGLCSLAEEFRSLIVSDEYSDLIKDVHDPSLPGLLVLAEELSSSDELGEYHGLLFELPMIMAKIILGISSKEMEKKVEVLEKEKKRHQESKAAVEETIKAFEKEKKRHQESEAALQESMKAFEKEKKRHQESKADLEETINTFAKENERHQESKAALEKNIKALLKENERHHESQICKVCLDKEVQDVFVPCGHLATCSECSNHINICPVCRCDIHKKIRVYKS